MNPVYQVRRTLMKLSETELEDGRLKRVSLARVTSVAEEAKKEMQKPDVPKTLGLHLDRGNATCPPYRLESKICVNKSTL